VARLPDRLCRFLDSGDVDGDGRPELVAAAHRSGVWLLRPGPERAAPWSRTQIDAESSGFEHAALVADLDGDGAEELYVAGDDQGQICRYTWRGGKPEREVILRRAVPRAFFTWNLMPLPAELVP
jgi:hypothetical protein